VKACFSRQLLIFYWIFMAAQAGNFFPPDYKIFAFKEGDLLVSRSSNGKFAINKILKIDQFDIKKGASINIQGQSFIATEDDYLLIVSASYGVAEFNSIEEARHSAQVGKWQIKLEHAPNRAPGAAEGQLHIGNAEVLQHELYGYNAWLNAFKKGEAGVF
jgi:hypothetical protein